MTKIVSDLNIWAKNCVENGIELWKLEEDNYISLYMTKSKYLCDNIFYYNSPIYHVWSRDKCICSSPNYKEAFLVFKNKG